MITWIAAYPKSGNTWVRAFLADLLAGGDGPLALTDLAERVPSAAFRPLLDEALGVETSDLTEDEVERVRPAAYAHLAGASAGPVWLKIHDAHAGRDGRALVPAEATSGAVVVVRDPADVAVSLAHHMGWPAERSIDFMGDPAADLAGERGGLSIQVRQRLGRWGEHVTGWLDAPGLAVLAVRYEDLLARPETEFARLASFALPEATPDAVERAIERTRFDALRDAERRDGFAEAAAPDRPFFRRGVSGAGRAELTERQIRRIVRDHGPAMRRLGYAGAGDAS